MFFLGYIIYIIWPIFTCYWHYRISDFIRALWITMYPVHTNVSCLMPKSLWLYDLPLGSFGLLKNWILKYRPFGIVLGHFQSNMTILKFWPSCNLLPIWLPLPPFSNTALFSQSQVLNKYELDKPDILAPGYILAPGSPIISMWSSASISWWRCNVIVTSPNSNHSTWPNNL